MMGPRGESREPEGLHVLRGVVICGLALSSGAPIGVLNSFFRAATTVLAGRALAAGLASGEATGRSSVRPWTVRIALGWLATFSPVVLVASPEVVRSWAAAAWLSLVLRRLRNGPTVVLAAGLFVAAFTAAGSSPPSGLLDELGYALGATWPRGWSDVAALMGLFLLGAIWARRSAAAPAAVHDRARPPAGPLAPLAALGRMPLTAVLAHSLLTSPLTVTRGNAPWGGTPLACALLLAEMLAAHRWLHVRKHGPAEHALHVARAALSSGVLSLRRWVRPIFLAWR